MPSSDTTFPHARRRARVALVAAIFLGAAVAAALADAPPSLYGPEAPQDVAFLRAVNASPAPVTVRLADGDPQALDPGEATDYLPVPPDQASFAWAPAEGDEAPVAADAAPESFLTLLIRDGGARVLDDEVLRDISRGLLVFVNASEAGPLTLRLADGTEVFGEVEDDPASMTIAEGEAELEVVDPSSGEALARLDGRTLARGSAHTVLAFDGPEGLTVVHIEAALAD